MSKAKVKPSVKPDEAEQMTSHQIDVLVNAKIVEALTLVKRQAELSGRSEISVEHVEEAIRKFVFNNLS